MAQYHFAAAIVTRSKGQSVVAAAAYRAGECLVNERTGQTYDYTRRRGVLHTEVCTPADTPDWMVERGPLWNAIEKVEKRRDSQLARSLDIALPWELNLQQNIELIRDFVRAVFVSRGMIADIAIHAPSRTGDARNIHAHILLTTREIAGPGFGPKARGWNRREELEEWREAWAGHANRILEREGFDERIDHRSLVDQGIDREPTTHVGPDAKEMERQGTPSDRAKRNRDIKATNDNLAFAKIELAESQKRLAELRRQLAAERMEEIQKTVRAVDAAWDKTEPAPAPERPAEPPVQQPAPPRIPPLRPTTAAGRMEQIQKTARMADAVWEKAERPVTPGPDKPPEPEPPTPEPPAPKPPTPPAPTAPSPRSRPPSKYADLDELTKREQELEAERKKQQEREQEHIRKRKRGR